MKLLTRQTVADGAAEFWRKRIEESKSANSGRYAQSDFDIWSKITELGEHPDPDAVDAIIGNVRWTYLYCSCCGNPVAEAVRMREGIAFEEENIDLCRDCIGVAQSLFKAIEMIADLRANSFKHS